MIGREWLSTLRYKFEPVTKGELDVNFIEKDEEIWEETKKLINESKKRFERNKKTHQVKINLREEAKIFLQMGKRIPIQMQNAVDSEKRSW